MHSIDRCDIAPVMRRDWAQFIAAWNPDPHRVASISFDDTFGFCGHHDGLWLRSAFQPVFSTTSPSPVAHEALLRATDSRGRSVRPDQVFERTTRIEDTVFLDRLCRMLHVANFARQNPGNSKLYLNMDGRNLMTVNSGQHGRFFDPLLAMCGLTHETLVLEIMESRISDHDRLVEAVAAYTRQGFRIAIDDFGARDSNFDRLWMLSPHVVKMDRSLIVHATQDIRVYRMLPKLVEIVHELEAAVIFEGIETDAQHAIAVDAGADMLQGFYRARPAAGLRF